MNEGSLCWRGLPPLFFPPQKGFLLVRGWREPTCILMEAVHCLRGTPVSVIRRVVELTSEGMHASLLRTWHKSGDKAILEGDQ